MLFRKADDRRQLFGQGALVLAWLGVTTIGALVLDPSPKGHGTHQQLGLPPCPSMLVFQRPCPGCGLTTSFTALLHGDFAAAFSAHALGPLLYALFTATAVLAGYGLAKNERLLPASRLADTVLIGVAIALVAYGGVRFMTTRVPLKDVLPTRLVAEKPLSH